MRVRIFLAVTSGGFLPSLVLAQGEPACPVGDRPLESAQLKMPEMRSTGETHNPQEADVVVEFIVDSGGSVSAVKVVRSETWPVRAGGPSIPHYFDKAALDQVASRRYTPRTQSCRGEATIRFRFEP
jgi:TonB family protein